MLLYARYLASTERSSPCPWPKRRSSVPFAALADFKQIVERAKKLTRHELLRSTLVSPGAKLLIAATAMRAYRKRHLGTLMHSCAAWDPVGQCFEEVTFECTNFHELSQIIASLTRENIAGREAAVHNLPGCRLKKTMPLPGAEIANGHGPPRSQCPASTQSRMRKDASLTMKTNQVQDYVLDWGRIF